ncbi:sensor histidine kinase [Streptomyces sp. NPDC057757]|uniref:sensor histidine kinase n=1 Tax=Streptomyces sp. NPDC057757 TaxID=3346241 RepID=UPI0036B20E93
MMTMRLTRLRVGGAGRRGAGRRGAWPKGVGPRRAWPRGVGREGVGVEGVGAEGVGLSGVGREDAGCEDAGTRGAGRADVRHRDAWAGAGWPTGTRAGYLADDAPPPGSVRLQLNALQALCRQAFAVRLVAIAIGAPVAMANTADGPPRYAVLAAAVLGVMGSYAMLRDWDRFGPRLLAHPTLMAVDLGFGAILLLTASPASPLAYATVCTPLLAGLLYGWRGSGVFTGLQLIVLLLVFRAWEHHPGAGANTLLIAGFCVGAGIIGVTLRNLMFRFGTASQALSEATSRLAVAEAVESERARLAREMHDSVAKTLHGLALAAEALAASADASANASANESANASVEASDRAQGPEGRNVADASEANALKALKGQATTVADAARRAAAESRALLSDLRHHTDLVTELAVRVADFESHTRIRTSLNHKGGRCPSLPDTTAHHVLAIVSEALENTHRHADAKRVTIELEASDTDLTIRVQDDGRGLPAAATLQDAAKTGHFGLLGMTERAATLNARIHLGPSPQGGAEVAVTLPVAAPVTPRAPSPPRQEAAHA